MLIANRDFKLSGDKEVLRGQKVVGLPSKLEAMLVRTKFVVEKEDVGPTRLIVTNRPHREGRLGFRWDGKWYSPGDVLPEDNLPLKKRMTLLNVDWVREEPIPPKVTRKRKTTKRKKQKQLKRVA